MDNCKGCGLLFFLARLFSCDHCQLPHCIVCLKRHAADLTMTFRTVPKMAGKPS